MAKSFSPKVVTANHLLEGDVIYRTPAGTWSPWLNDAELFIDEADAEQALGAATLQTDVAVGPYLADAAVAASGTAVPVHFREEFRSRGPSNYAHGKQVEYLNV